MVTSETHSSGYGPHTISSLKMSRDWGQPIGRYRMTRAFAIFIFGFKITATVRHYRSHYMTRQVGFKLSSESSWEQFRYHRDHELSQVLWLIGLKISYLPFILQFWSVDIHVCLFLYSVLQRLFIALIYWFIVVYRHWLEGWCTPHLHARHL